jgi:hypothetical protein
VELLSEALVFNAHALRRNLHLGVDGPNRLRAANAVMIALTGGDQTDALPRPGTPLHRFLPPSTLLVRIFVVL